MSLRTDGWYGLTCWNGLSSEQQRRLVEVGNLPVDYVPEGECDRGAAVEITTMSDAAPGPRFYCRQCAAEYLAGGSTLDANRVNYLRALVRQARKRLDKNVARFAPKPGQDPEEAEEARIRMVRARDYAADTEELLRAMEKR